MVGFRLLGLGIMEPVAMEPVAWYLFFVLVQAFLGGIASHTHPFSKITIGVLVLEPWRETQRDTHTETHTQRHTQRYFGSVALEVACPTLSHGFCSVGVSTLPAWPSSSRWMAQQFGVHCMETLGGGPTTDRRKHPLVLR